MSIPNEYKVKIRDIVKEDSRYGKGAYEFVGHALNVTVEKIIEAEKGQHRHISGQELLEGIRIFALDQFGPMTFTVLSEWGLKATIDFGHIVFNMIDHELLSRTEEDSLEDFYYGYDFHEAFAKPFEVKVDIRPLNPIL